LLSCFLDLLQVEFIYPKENLLQIVCTGFVQIGCPSPNKPTVSKYYKDYGEIAHINGIGQWYPLFFALYVPPFLSHQNNIPHFQNCS